MTPFSVKFLLTFFLVGFVLVGKPSQAQKMDWGEVSDFSPIGAINDTIPFVAISADGTKATAVWNARVGETETYLIKSRSATINGNIAAWGTESEVAVSSSTQESPRVSLSVDGSIAIVVWMGWDDSGDHLMVRSSIAMISGNAASWSDVADISLTTEQVTRPPVVSLSADGTRATVAWSAGSISERKIQSISAVINGNLASWGAVYDLFVVEEGNLEGTQVIVSEDGARSTAMWSHLDGHIETVYSASSTINGKQAAWGAVSQLSITGQEPNKSHLTLSGDGGRALAIWVAGGATPEIQVVSATISGNIASWSSVLDLTPSEDFADHPRMAISSDGTTAIGIWYILDHNLGDTYFQSRVATFDGDSVNWSNISNVVKSEGYALWYPEIDISSNGRRATVVWGASNHLGHFVQSKSADIRGHEIHWGALEEISPAGERITYPKVAMSSDGAKATAIWRGEGNSDFVVQSASAILSENCYVITSGNQKTVVFCI